MRAVCRAESDEVDARGRIVVAPQARAAAAALISLPHLGNSGDAGVGASSNWCGAILCPGARATGPVLWTHPQGPVMTGPYHNDRVRTYRVRRSGIAIVSAAPASRLRKLLHL